MAGSDDEKHDHSQEHDESCDHEHDEEVDVVTLVDADDQALMKHFGIIGPPTIMFFTPDGREQASRRIVGFKPAAEFAAHVQAVFQEPAATALATAAD